MFPVVVTKDPVAVEGEVTATCRRMFPDGDTEFVGKVFSWTLECFTGQYRDYLPIDAVYHDLEHTLQGTLCLVRLLEGRHNAGAFPRLNCHQFELAVLAGLLHDTGYLKHLDDTAGTGAKYTATHVTRSAEFAEMLLSEKGCSPTAIRSVQNMIRCTGVNAKLEAIRFQDSVERISGCALATADILGQMAAEDYVRKLPILYQEFQEAASFSKAATDFVASFASATDLMRRTPQFWRAVVLPKLEADLGGLYRYLNQPFPDGPNAYLERIQANLELLSKTD